ncbi:MAG: hypothetical protein ABIF77_00590 [bacterium]
MIRESEPGKWPICGGLALIVLWLIVFQVPASWIELFFSPLGHPITGPTARRPTAVLHILPPPVIVPDESPQPVDSQAKPPPIPETLPPPEWWRTAWEIHIENRSSDEIFVAAPSESLLELARDLIGYPTVSRLLAEPDSSLATRLAFLRLRNQQQFAAVREYLLGVPRQKLYRQILNQAATLYDEFLLLEIEVTDLPPADQQ